MAKSKHYQTPRSSLEIKMATLDYLFKHKGDKGVPITHIMYSVNLSWLKTMKVTSELIKTKCMQKREWRHGSTRDIFEITVKGTHALKHYKIGVSELK